MSTEESRDMGAAGPSDIALSSSELGTGLGEGTSIWAR